MSDVEEVQEQMKVDLEAMKDQMTTMMEAIMSMRKMMLVNVATVVGTSTAIEVNPTYPSAIEVLGSTSSPYFVQV